MPQLPPWSSQFILYTDSAPNLTFEVPAANVAVLRDFTAFATVAATFAQLRIQNSEAAPAITVASLELAAIEAYEQWTGRVVVPGGGVISLNLGSLAAGLEIYVGGYLLNASPS